MFIETKTFTVKEGTSNIVVERFTGEGIIEKFEGFIDLSVLVKKVRRGDEEVVVMIRESEEAWKNWETSEEHLVDIERAAVSQNQIISLRLSTEFIM